MKFSPLPAIIVALGLGLACAPDTAGAKPWWLRNSTSNEADFLPPDVAFRVRAQIDGNTVKLRWVIADGYYLYRRSIEVVAESPDLIVAAPQLPPGVVKTDVYLGTQQIYTQQLEADVPFSRYDGGAHPLQIKVTYQGCAEAGLCYPPITKVLFPLVSPTQAAAPAATDHPWEGVAIMAGVLSFLLAGLVLRRGRQLDTPAA